jgi:hypothetical protein
VIALIICRNIVMIVTGIACITGATGKTIFQNLP